MTYAQFGLVQASDYNSLVGSITTANTLNATWSTGSGSAGYGQTLVANVSAGNTISASSWANIVTTTSNAATHQGTTLISVPVPLTGNLVAYTSAIATNLQTIYTNKLNASIQGNVANNISNTATFSSAWQNSVTFTLTATFANGDAARYFFNSGGQLRLSCSHPSGTGINQTLNGLASNIGNVFISAPTSGTAVIASNNFTGITKVGGGGNSPSPYLTNNGYYALTSSNANVFSQTATTGPSLATNISFLIKSNGTQGSNSDAGSVITVYAVWDQVPDGLVASIGSATTLSVLYPEQTYIANNWGAVTLASSSSGS